MIYWDYDESTKVEDFTIIPEADYRVRITEVTEKTFKSGNNGFELTFEVNGYKSKVWFYIVLNPSDREKTNKALGKFFDSFGIEDHNIANYAKWVGKTGACAIKHEDYNGSKQAKVKWLIGRKAQDVLPKWEGTADISVEEDDLPFD